MKTIKRKPITLTGDVTTFAANSGEPIRTFAINAYTGAVVDAYFGKLVFDVSGMSAKPRIPILREHARDRIVGFGESSQDGKTFSVTGQFSESTPDGKECLSLAAEGYPWQASVGVRPCKVRVLSVKESATVNGQPVTGPAEIWLKSEVGEVSFVSLGADNNTSISVFADSAVEVEAEIESSDEAEPQETNQGGKSMTKEEFLTQYPDMAAELKAEGITEERERAMAILSHETDHYAILKSAVECGTAADGIFKALYEAERNFRMGGLQKLADQAPPSVGQTRDEVIDTPVMTFMGEVEKLSAAGMTRAQALKKTAGDHPDLHDKYIKDINERR